MITGYSKENQKKVVEVKEFNLFDRYILHKIEISEFSHIMSRYTILCHQ